MTTIEKMNARSHAYLPGLLGIEFLTLEPGRLTSRLVLRPELLAPNGWLPARCGDIRPGRYCLRRHTPLQRTDDSGLRCRSGG
jgi:hypothetical protein